MPRTLSSHPDAVRSRECRARNRAIAPPSTATRPQPSTPARSHQLRPRARLQYQHHGLPLLAHTVVHTFCYLSPLSGAASWAPNYLPHPHIGFFMMHRLLLTVRLLQKFLSPL